MCNLIICHIKCWRFLSSILSSHAFTSNFPSTTDIWTHPITFALNIANTVSVEIMENIQHSMGILWTAKIIHKKAGHIKGPLLRQKNVRTIIILTWTKATSGLTIFRWKSNGISERKMGTQSDRPSATALRTFAAIKKEHDRKIPAKLQIDSNEVPIHFKPACLKTYFIRQETWK
jgi:hypothetical protein